MVFAKLKTTGKRELSLLGVMFGALAFWTFNRMANVNPAILQDEFIYTYSSRRIGFWDQAPAYDFGNYLFNVIYSSTLFCGDAFYTCGKVLNLIFFSGFVFVLFLIALRFLNFWWALGVAAAVYLSPVSVYVSMYLPESLYFFLISCSVLLVVLALESDSWRSWLVAGAFLGAAGLAKPHALISLMAFGLFIFIYSIGKRPFFKPLLVRGLSVLGGYLAIRVGLGFLLAGPKSLNVFGAYGASTGVGELVGTVATGSVQETTTLVGAGPVEGALGLFPLQLLTHGYTLVSLLGAAIAALILVTIRIAAKGEATPKEAFALFVLIWLGVMVISIVLFTGWITGQGDDHTTRVLLRYYDFLFPIVALAAVVMVVDPAFRSAPAWQRWLGVALPAVLATSAFTGFFATLTIQIADAPNLAGFVVDKFVADGVGILGFIALLIIAFYPGLAKYGVAGFLAFSLILGGWQAQGQYTYFRESDSASDVAGMLLRKELTDLERSQTLIIANSRFDARVASLWMDSNNDLLLRGEETPILDGEIPGSYKYALILGNHETSVEYPVTIKGDGFKLIEIGLD